MAFVSQKTQNVSFLLILRAYQSHGPYELVRGPKSRLGFGHFVGQTRHEPCFSPSNDIVPYQHNVRIGVNSKTTNIFYVNKRFSLDEFETIEVLEKTSVNKDLPMEGR